MDAMSSALRNADQLLSELQSTPEVGRQAPTMGRLKKLSYTHESMVDLIIENPLMTKGQLAAAFDRTPSWISNILASDAFQLRMASRREEILDPELKATIEERFRALVIQSLDVLQTKLSQPVVSDNVALRAAELGAKALGVGGHAPPPVPAAQDRLERLAERLVSLQSRVRERVVLGEVLEVKQEAA